MIHEPLNREYGLSEVRHVYPCDFDAEQERRCRALLARLLDGKAGCCGASPGTARAKALARAACGGRTGLDVAKFRLRRLLSPSLQPLFKDPFAALLSRSLIREGSRVLALVRHPAAVWLSIKRMEWEFCYADFAYPGVFRDLGLPVSAGGPGHPARGREIRLAVDRHLHLSRAARRATERFLLVRHEDLCAQPHVELQRMAAFFGLAAARKARDFIDQAPVCGTRSRPPGKRLHVFERNAAALPTAWHGRLGNEEEVIIRAVCGPLVERYYGRWLPA